MKIAVYKRGKMCYYEMAIYYFYIDDQVGEKKSDKRTLVLTTREKNY